MTTNRRFLETGHLPTLIGALLYFDVSFMVWVLLGPLAPFLREELGLTATQQGLLVAVPLLGGSFFRPLLGMAGDRFGGRRTGLIGLALTLVPLLVGWRFAHSLEHFYVMGVLLGVAGASFAVALPLASRWYPSEHQGLAMGIAGAGNSGSLLATLAAPRLAQRFGWATTFGLMMIPVLIVMVLFAMLAKDSPRHRTRQTWKDYAAVLRERDTLWFSLPLRPDLWRLRRLHQLPHDVLQRSVPACRRSAPATSPRSSSLPEACCGRSAAGCRIGSAATACCCCCWSAWRLRSGGGLHSAAAAGGDRAAVRRDRLPRDGQRRGLPAGAAALRRPHGPDHRHRRRGRRTRRILPAVDARRGQGSAGTYAPGLLLLAFGFFAGALGLLHLGSVWTHAGRRRR